MEQVDSSYKVALLPLHKNEFEISILEMKL